MAAFMSSPLMTRSPSLTSLAAVTPVLSLAETLNVSPPLSPPPSPPLLLGHRGSPYTYFENTLPSFLSSSLHSDGIEIDIFPLLDDTLVCYHGKGNDKECGFMIDSHGIDISIKELTFTDLPKAILPSFGDKACEIGEGEEVEIPRLEDVLERFKGQGFIVTVELKSDNTEKLLVDLLKKIAYPLSCITVSSFHHPFLQTVKALNPLIQTACLFNSPLPSDYISQTKETGASECHLRYDTCTKENVEKAKEEGLKVMSWCSGPKRMSEEVWSDVGNEDEDFYNVILRTGVDKVCVNKPDLARKVMNKIWGDNN